MSFGGLIASAMGGAASGGVAMADKIATEKRKHKGLLEINKIDNENKVLAAEVANQNKIDAATVAWDRNKEMATLSHNRTLQLERIRINSQEKMANKNLAYQREQGSLNRNNQYNIANIKASTAPPVTNINLGEGMKEEHKELGKIRARNMGDLQERSLAAQDQLSLLSQMNSIDLKTGFGVEARANVAKVITGLGGDGAALTGVDPADTEKFKAISEKQVLNIMATQKGPQTDQDAERIKRTVMQLGNTSESNNFILNAASAIAHRQIEQAAFSEQYLEEKDTLKGVESAWRNFKKDTPMISEIVKNPETGNPMFYHQFQETMQNQGHEKSDIINAWRILNKEDK